MSLPLSARMPMEDIQEAIQTRLNLKIVRLPINGGLPIPVYDSVPESDKSWNFIEIASVRTTQIIPYTGLWQVRVQFDVFSEYQGYKEVNSEASQINGAFATPLEIPNRWTDVQFGGVAVEVETSKVIFEKGGPIVRIARFLHSWQVSDDTI